MTSKSGKYFERWEQGTMFNLNTFIADTKRDGGATFYDPFTEEQRQLGRYVIGGIETYTIPVHGIDWRHVRAIVSTMATQVDGVRVETFGSWIDGDRVVFDLGDTRRTLRYALDVARERGEKAIYDRVDNKVINVT